MLQLLTDLFINLCVLIALIFIYLQLKWKLELEKKLPFGSNIIDGIAGGFLGFILMQFSIQINPETIIDLRFIPIMLIAMFSGTSAAIVSTIIIIVGRFIIGGISTSTIAAFILLSILLLGLITIHKIYKSTNPYKISFVMILFSNIIFSFIISYVLKDYDILKKLLPVYWTISIIGGLISVFFVEYIRKTQYLLTKYEQESVTDFLTGLNNVRQFDATWNALLKNAVEKNEKLSLLIIDIDYFKKVNDTYGHPAGDRILIELGQILKIATRSFDIVSRNGGEEFSVILPDCPNQQSIEIAERIRQKVESHEFSISPQETIHITVSIGVATYPETVTDSSKIVKTADECLYVAKHSGRNKVCSNPRETL